MYECKGLRTRTGKTFYKETGRYVTRCYRAPIHYPLGDEWVEFDAQWADWHSLGSSIEVSVVPGSSMVRLHHLETDTDATLEIIEPSIRWPSKAFRDGRNLTFSDVTTDLNIQISVKPSGIQVWKILKTAKAPKRFVVAFDADENFPARLVHHARGRDNVDELDVGRPKHQPSFDLITRDSIYHSNKGAKKSSAVIQEWDGKSLWVVDKVTRSRQPVQDASQVIYPCTMHAFTQEITTALDDGQETDNTTWSGTGTEADAGTTSTEYANAGFRFTNVTIDAGATINSAELQICLVQGQGTPSIEVRGDDVTDAAAWGSTDRPSQMTDTTANENSFPSWSDSAYNNINITDIIQEIVNNGFASGNDIRVAINTLVESGAGYHRLRVRAYNPYVSPSPCSTQYAVLDVDWSGGAACVPCVLLNMGDL